MSTLLNNQIPHSVRCADCQYFIRGKWHKAVDPDESNQCGGSCSVLAAALKMGNAELFIIESLHVYETFGCLLGRHTAEAATGHNGRAT